MGHRLPRHHLNRKVCRGGSDRWRRGEHASALERPVERKDCREEILLIDSEKVDRTSVLSGRLLIRQQLLQIVAQTTGGAGEVPDPSEETRLLLARRFHRP